MYTNRRKKQPEQIDENEVSDFEGCLVEGLKGFGMMFFIPGIVGIILMFLIDGFNFYHMLFGGFGILLIGFLLIRTGIYIYMFGAIFWYLITFRWGKICNISMLVDEDREVDSENKMAVSTGWVFVLVGPPLYWLMGTFVTETKEGILAFIVVGLFHGLFLYWAMVKKWMGPLADHI